MPMIYVYVSDSDYERLCVFAADSGREISELAESAISEAAVQAVPKMNGKFMNSAHQAIADRLTKEA
jgi:hypothetical protein